MARKTFVKITREPLSPEAVVGLVKTKDSGCVATYIGLIRDNSRGKTARSVEYSDPHNTAEAALQSIVDEAMQRWPINATAMYHRIGELKVNDINLVIAIGAGHRKEGFEACAFTVDEFKARLPTHKKETYSDGTTYSGHD